LKRRKFIQKSSLTGLGIAVAATYVACADETSSPKVLVEKDSANKAKAYPMVLATWDVQQATSKAWEVLQSGRSALDAVEEGVMV
jgi:N4-(beta-N-acetylglucosaminyl)-L-asparaginase